MEEDANETEWRTDILALLKVAIFNKTVMNKKSLQKEKCQSHLVLNLWKPNTKWEEM